MALLNNTAYEVDKDELIYDAKRPIDVKIIHVSITTGNAGVIKRGQVIDFADGEYKVHALSGVPCAIAAEETSYAADDSEIAVTAYISGTFRTSRVISEPELTVADKEELRSKGIILK